MTATLLLFDVDGTLISTSGVGIRAMELAGRDLFGSRFVVDGTEFAGRLDPACAWAFAGLSANTFSSAVSWSLGSSITALSHNQAGSIPSSSPISSPPIRSRSPPTRVSGSGTPTRGTW